MLNVKLHSTLLGLVACFSSVHAGQKLSVKIIDRQNNETGYSYVVPGQSNTNSNTTVNCNGGNSSANCSGSTNTTRVSTPAQTLSYNVSGATFTLQLPNGKLAVVNCESKANLTEFTHQPRRSCRVPLVNDIEAEFDGDKAKLRWPVSIDGKKFESETYKILAVMDKLTQ
jgi:hypothetical protein